MYNIIQITDEEISSPTVTSDTVISPTVQNLFTRAAENIRNILHRTSSPLRSVITSKKEYINTDNWNISSPLCPTCEEYILNWVGYQLTSFDPFSNSISSQSCSLCKYLESGARVGSKVHQKTSTSKTNLVCLLYHRYYIIIHYIIQITCISQYNRIISLTTQYVTHRCKQRNIPLFNS